jgi:hypothetical protein
VALRVRTDFQSSQNKHPQERKFTGRRGPSRNLRARRRCSATATTGKIHGWCAYSCTLAGCAGPCMTRCACITMRAIDDLAREIYLPLSNPAPQTNMQTRHTCANPVPLRTWQPTIDDATLLHSTHGIECRGVIAERGGGAGLERGWNWDTCVLATLILNAAVAAVGGQNTANLTADEWAYVVNIGGVTQVMDNHPRWPWVRRR